MCIRDRSKTALQLEHDDHRRKLFLDVVHSVRAVLRLAHWESMLGETTISKSLRGQAASAISFESINHWLSDLEKRAYHFLRDEAPEVLETEVLAPGEVTPEEIEVMDKPYRKPLEMAAESTKKISAEPLQPTRCKKALNEEP